MGKNFLSPEEANATIAEVFPKQCRALADNGQQYSCTYRRGSMFERGGAREKAEWREKSPVAVGDRVKLVPMNLNEAVIEGVARRKNQLTRSVPEREGWLQVVVANLDGLVIVASAQDPPFSPGLADRFLVAAQKEDIGVLLCVNKMDLYVATGEKPWGFYSELGLEIHEVSAKTEVGLSSLSERLKGKTVAFCGHSGVGKTSLLNQLLGTSDRRVEEVNPITGKGRHTTTCAVLLGGPEKSCWIDTPGIRSFGLPGIKPTELAQYFQEFSALSCASRGCLHLDEPRCEARNLFRYSSYCRIYESLVSKR